MTASMQTPVFLLLLNIVIDTAGVVANLNDGHPFLLVLEKKTLTKIDLDNASNYVNQTELIHAGTMSAFDYDYEKGLLFYSAWNTIIKSTFVTSDKNMIVGNFETVASTNISIPNGLCVDWINERIYWTENGLSLIDVTNYDGSQRVTLFSSGLDEPESIAVDPFTGFMFWTDWGRSPRIERATMSGDDRVVIVEAGIGWPHGMCLDIEEKRLYFVDSSIGSIESFNYDGSDKKEIVSPDISPNVPYAVDIHEDFVYWIDWSMESAVYRADKTTGKNAEAYFKNLTNLVRLFRVVYPREENKDIKVCDDQRSPCAPHEMCLPTPQTNEEGKVTHKCVSTSSSQPARSEISGGSHNLKIEAAVTVASFLMMLCFQLF